MSMRVFRPLVLVLALVAVGVSGCSSSRQGADSPARLKQLAAFVSSLTHGTGDIRLVFPGPAGLTGILVQGGQNPPVVLFATPDGKYLIAGNLYDRRGVNLTQKALDHFGPSALPAGFSSATHVLAPSLGTPIVAPGTGTAIDPAKAAYVSAGKGSRPVYVFFDPDCIWCHKLWLSIKSLPPATLSDIDFRWIPIAFVHPEDSEKKGARILSEGWKALEANEELFDDKKESGGAVPLDDPALIEKVRANASYLSKVETPTIVYRSAFGMKIYEGYPDTPTLLKILGAAVK